MQETATSVEPLPQPVRCSGPVRFGVVLLALGQVVALGIGGLALRDGLLVLKGETCPMGEFGATMYALMALICFDLPLLVATVLLVRLARRQLPRWTQIGLLAGLGAGILVPLAALVCTWVRGS